MSDKKYTMSTHAITKKNEDSVTECSVKVRTVNLIEMF